MPRGRKSRNENERGVPLFADTSHESEEQSSFAQQDEDYNPDQSQDDSVETSEDYIDDSTASGVSSARKRAGRGRGRGRGGGRGANRGNQRSFSRNSMDATASKANEDANTLFEHVKQGRAALQSVVDEWIESYRQDREAASLELMQFFIRSSGCKGKITHQMRETMDNAQIIRQLVEEFDDEAGGDYPLIMTGPQWKKFRSGFCEFVHTLVRQCQYSIIYDQYLMESIISLLITLSDSQARAFRHTATLAAMKLMTALVDVALTLSINLDNTQRQYESERQKTREKRASDRLDMLMSKRQELEENMEDIRTMLAYLFKSIFVHRYRDTVPEIRSMCMSEIGIWMKRFPNHFLDDSYLKYVGWTLHDKVGDVRLKCLQSLLPLYETEEIACKMELFTNKFKDRIVAMTLDKEYEVAVQAVKLIISIHKCHKEVLTDKDCEHVYELVYATHRAVAQAAGEFLNERLFQVDEEATANLRSRRGKKRSVHTPLVRDLIQFFIESELHEHGAYLVDSLIESHPMMKDWECMTDLLLEEPGPEEEALDDRQETSLIEIMVCCVKQAATGEPPIGRGPVRKQISTKEAKQVQDDKNRISEHFIQTLPALLDKYKTDPEKIANLMCIPQYFDLSYFTQNQDQLETLLKLINEIIEIHSDTEVLEACAKTYEYLYDENFTFGRNVWLSRSSLIDTLAAKYKTAAENFSMKPDGHDETILITLILKKIGVFYSCHDLTSWNLWDDIFDRWIKGANQENVEIPVEAVKHAIISCHMGLIWELHLISESRSNNNNAQNLRSKLYDFMSEMRTLLNHQSDELEEEAFTTICDFLIIFSYNLESESPSVAPLVYKPDRSLIQQLETFILQKVFIDEDESEDEVDIQSNLKIKKIHKKRHFLSAYSKLVVYNIIPIRQAACVIKHYVKFYNDYGDIIKTTLGKAREINKIICAKTMASALIEVFLELQSESSMNPSAFTKQDENFQALKELAKRFALSFGLDNHKNRDAVAALHREGIHFTFNTVENPENPLGPPPNLPFLEILSEFSNKLIRQDKKTVLMYLDRYVKSALPGIHNDEWQPLMSYRSSLMQHNEFDIPLNRAPGRQYRGRKRNRDDDDEEGVDDDQGERDSEAGSEVAE
ncbi:cohesin subunit SA-1-like protein [Dinothrombium tinctorium]|uniref:Cohesin subunit SA-1-like protein n=1 Tax=Dinothrombium tinctorium TaxID=1965070 RepID=A0A3S3PFA7_9ACAR|nr:cohesin subunit SA-1-like protein [Dinothrombium tinctorium]